MEQPSLSDRDERNESVSAARDGVIAFFFVSGCLAVAKNRNTPIHRTTVQETLPKANLPPTSRTKQSLLLRNGRFYSRLLSPSSLVCRMDLSFPAERKKGLSPIMCQEAQLSAKIFLSSGFMIALSSDVFTFSIGEYPLKNVVLCSTFDFW